jgi:DNA-binding MarR family transcriptional regulator
MREILAIVEENPGITGKELSEKMGVTPGRVSQLLGEMGGDGNINRRRRGKAVGLHLSDVAIRRKLLRQRWTSDGK